MKRAYLFLVMPLLVACVPPGAMPDPVSAPDPIPAPQQQAPRPTPRPSTATPPRPNPPLAATPSSTALAAWADAPLSPGRWIYQAARGTGSRALFGPANGPSFQIACAAGRMLNLTRSGAAAGALTIRTTSTLRTLPGTRGPAGLSAQLTAGDPLMDAIAFSRGRFAVETAGAFALIIPNWPELARVVEDCRR